MRGRHGVNHAGKRRIIDFFVAAEMIAGAEAARLDAGQVSSQHLHGTVVAPLADFQVDGSRLNAHDAADQTPGGGLCKSLKRRTLLVVGPLIEDQYGLGWIRIVEPVA